MSGCQRLARYGQWIASSVFNYAGILDTLTPDDFQLKQSPGLSIELECCSSFYDSTLVMRIERNSV